MWDKFIEKFGPNQDDTGKSYVGKLDKCRVYAEHDTEYDYMDLSVLSECGFIHDTSRPIAHVMGRRTYAISDVYEYMFTTLCEMFEGVKRDVEAMK